MKSFIWRMRSTAVWFLAATALFTGSYLAWAYSNVRSPGEYNGGLNNLSGISPIVISMLSIFVFYLIYAKRYTFDEAYLYGESRSAAFGSAICGAAVYAAVFAFYVLGLALFVRRGILSASYMVVSSDLYRMSAAEVFFNFAQLFLTNMIAYETADILRKFKSWKFWIAAAVSITVAVALGVVFVLKPMDDVYSNFDFWKAIFMLTVPLTAIMIAGDIFMTRGRQYR